MRVDSLVLLPAVDVAGGQAVQLVQGKAGSEKKFGDPRAAARRWADAGAEWIHLVDLDAAFGRGDNAEVIAEVTASMQPEGRAVRRHPRRRDPRAGAGHRLRPGQHRHRRPGAARSGATRSSKTYGDRIAIGLDVRGTRLAARGWTSEGGDLYETLDRLDGPAAPASWSPTSPPTGCSSGPNLDLLRRVCARTDTPVVASGGISSLADIVALRDWSPSASRARSSAPPSTSATSPSRRPWRAAWRAAASPPHRGPHRPSTSCPPTPSHRARGRPATAGGPTAPLLDGRLQRPAGRSEDRDDRGDRVHRRAAAVEDPDRAPRHRPAGAGAPQGLRRPRATGWSSLVKKKIFAEVREAAGGAEALVDSPDPGHRGRPAQRARAAAPTSTWWCTAPATCRSTRRSTRPSPPTSSAPRR